MRYLETVKRVTESYAKGAKGLDGSTSFSYDANGNLSVLDRGKKQKGGEHKVSYLEYDLEGHIIGKADKRSCRRDQLGS